MRRPGVLPPRPCVEGVTTHFKRLAKPLCVPQLFLLASMMVPVFVLSPMRGYELVWMAVIPRVSSSELAISISSGCSAASAPPQDSGIDDALKYGSVACHGGASCSRACLIASGRSRSGYLVLQPDPVKSVEGVMVSCHGVPACRGEHGKPVQKHWGSGSGVTCP